MLTLSHPWYHAVKFGIMFQKISTENLKCRMNLFCEIFWAVRVRSQLKWIILYVAQNDLQLSVWDQQFLFQCRKKDTNVIMIRTWKHEETYCRSCKDLTKPGSKEPTLSCETPMNKNNNVTNGWTFSVSEISTFRVIFCQTWSQNELLESRKKSTLLKSTLRRVIVLLSQESRDPSLASRQSSLWILVLKHPS